MNTKYSLKAKGQAGFTLVELIVVIVILGILAATAVPRMFDMSSQARLAKMQALAGALKASVATTHSAWMAGGGVLACSGCSSTSGAVAATTVVLEGVTIPTLGGYPDVGGDGITNTVSADESTTGGTPLSGIILAAGLSNSDYVWSTKSTANTLTFTPDAAHPSCSVVYTEAVQTNSSTANTQSTLTTAPTVVVNANVNGC